MQFFLTNPSPICVLDEVDAPLDDSNVTRFCSLLDELTKITETKFIIITHHALTMSKMDRVYGVTMPEKGISQLVSVDLQKAEEYGNRLSRTLREHDLTRLTLQRPGLIETRVNDATAQVFSDLESITAN